MEMSLVKSLELYIFNNFLFCVDIIIACFLWDLNLFDESPSIKILSYEPKLPSIIIGKKTGVLVQC